jgi:nucleoside-diphosphate-sugar epimerase
LDHGESVRVLAQVNTGAEAKNLEELRAIGCDPIVGSVTDPAAVREATSGVDVVYHLAAAQHEAGKPDEHFRRVNVTGTRTMLEAAAGVRRFVHGSTIGVYRAGKGTVTTEESPTEPDNIYGVTKLEAEGLVRSFQDAVPAVIVRISETYGPGDRRLLKLFRAIRKGRYFHIGSSTNPHHPIYVDDLVEALRRASVAEAAVGETMVIPGCEVVTTQEMVDTIAKVLDVPPPNRRLPMPLLWSAAVVMETLARPLRITPPLHRRRMHFFVKGFDFRGDRARRILGFEAKVGFREGAQRTAQWYSDAGLL